MRHKLNAVWAKPRAWLGLALSLCLLTLRTLPATTQAQDGAVQTAALAVVRVVPQHCVDGDCNDAGVGSGVIIDPAGIILTAWHVTTLVQAKDPTVTPHTYADDFVIEMADSLVAKAHARYRAHLIATREKSDLALLRIYATVDKQPVGTLRDLPTLPLSEEKTSTERLRLMGFPPAGGASISYPVFEQSGFDTDDGGELLKVQGQLSRGFSGGPALVERNGHYEIVGVVIKARGEGAEIGLLRGIGELQQLDWQPGAQQVWADTVQVGTHTTNGEATLYISANLHTLDFVGRSAQLVAFVFDANKKPFTPAQSKLSRTQKGQLALPRNFTAQRFVEQIEPFVLSAPVKELGVPPEQLLFRIVLLDNESRKTLWDNVQFLPPQVLPNPPAPKSATPSARPTISSNREATQTAIAAQTTTAVATQLATIATSTPSMTATPSPTNTPDPAVQQTAEAARIATAVAITLAALPTATPTATPTPNLNATQTAEAASIATAIAATSAAQPRATPNATATTAARANAIQTAIVLTLTAQPTARAKVVAYRPSEENIQHLQSLWSLTNFQDVTEPGQRTYNVTISSGQEWRWTFAWCATDNARLQEIVQPLNVDFQIEDVSLPQSSILQHRTKEKKGDQCRFWSTALTNWQSGETVKLTIDYSLSDAIFDGHEHYLAGDYQQIIFVAVQ